MVEGNALLFHCEPRPLGPHTSYEHQCFYDADTTFKGAMISMLGDYIVGTYVTMAMGKEMWKH
jgi:hypothetical protein